jgi:hypothetical protein
MSETWNRALHEGLRTGSIASLTSAAALAAAGRRAGCGAWAPLNAPSHWLFADAALRCRGPSARYTGTGCLIHHASSVMWGVLHARYVAGPPEARTSLPGQFAAGAVTAALACLVDYRLTPRALSPGFEHHLSRSALFGVYAALALGFGLSSWLQRRGNGIAAPSRARSLLAAHPGRSPA